MTKFPNTLKTWRNRRRMSQLDLSVQAEISSRHLSFLETGRARPSRDMVLRLGAALDVPLMARNQMLGDAGFASQFEARAWDDGQMAPIRAAVDHTLTNHGPYPGLSFNRLWVVQQMNPAAARLFGMLGLSKGDSLLDLIIAPHLPSVIENWPQFSHYVQNRLRTESAAQGGVVELDQVADYLDAHAAPADPTPAPVVPVVFVMGDLRLSLFATIAQFGTPLDVTLDDLSVELYFPADDATKNTLLTLAGQA